MIRRLLTACAAVLVFGCATVRPAGPAPVSLRPLAPGVLLHTSWKELPGVGPFPSNGLVLLGTSHAALVDTAWGDAPTAALLDEVERVHGRKVTHLLVTHSHDDRMGGIREALRRGVAVHALRDTADRARAAATPR